MRELEDYSWFPESFRRHQMDFLSLLAMKFGLYLPVKPTIEKILSLQENADWTDACSGSGGPVLSLAGQHRVLLTDLFPSFDELSLPENISFHPKPADITFSLPPGTGLITLFNCFHHFDEGQQKKIIEMCRMTGRPVVVVEILQPTALSMVSVIITTTIGHWLLVPFMKPFRFKRLFFTYLLPLHTLSVLFDGIVSVFKSKGRRYYRNLALALDNESYRVVFEKIPGPFGPLFLVKGVPVK